MTTPEPSGGVTLAGVTAAGGLLNSAEFAEKFETLLRRLGSDLAEVLANVYSSWQSGKLTTDELVDTIASCVSQMNAGARAMADRVATWQVSGRDRPPIGPTIQPGDDLPRLRQAARTIIDNTLDTVATTEPAESDQPGTNTGGITVQLERLAHNEPVEAAQQQAVDTYAGHGVTGYRRHPNPDACELCIWLVKAHLDPEGIGYIYPTNKPMHRHTGCRCTPVPATKKERNTHQ